MSFVFPDLLAVRGVPNPDRPIFATASQALPSGLKANPMLCPARLVREIGSLPESSKS